MIGMYQEVWHWMFYFLMFGTALHVLDRWIGVPFYRWFYNRSRETAMPAKVDMGFMYGRGLVRRQSWAMGISTLQSAYMIFTKGINPFVEIIVLVFESQVLLVGFFLGRYIYALMKRQKEIAETVDRFGNEFESNPGGMLSGVKDRVVGSFSETMRGWFNVKRSAATSAKPIETTVAPKAESETPKPHWRDRLDSYTKKG